MHAVTQARETLEYPQPFDNVPPTTCAGCVRKYAIRSTATIRGRRIGWGGRHDHARAVAQAVCAVDHNGGGRHRDDIMQPLHQKLRVDELIRRQRIVSIVELRSHFHGTGGGIDLAVIAAPPPVASILTFTRS
jgi:hypothetical protein